MYLYYKKITSEYAKLIGQNKTNKTAANQFFSGELSKAENGTTLFVFDNFETVSEPKELFAELDTHIHSPNKILITTRFREFKGDYNIEVGGMQEEECNNLITTTSEFLKIEELITGNYRSELYSESAGHPYVIKIILGEVVRNKKVERILADQDGILTALFEHTYSHLSPAAKRIFLTLCSWRSVVPVLAIKAVLCLPRNEERIDVENTIQDLENNSMIEISKSETDKQEFLNIPLVTRLFGLKKIKVDPLSSAVNADVELLQIFGAAQKTDVQKGLEPRVRHMLKEISTKLVRGTWRI